MTRESEVIPAGEAAPRQGFVSLCRRLGWAGPLALVALTIPPLGGLVVITLTPLIAPLLQGHAILGPLAFLLIGIVVIGLALAPTTSTSILAGWAFGFALGFPLAMLTLTLAGLFAYWIVRRVARDRLLDIILERPRARAVYDALLGQSPRNSLLIVTLLRLPPLAPYATANFVFGAMRVPLPVYTLGTIIGMVPRTAAAAFAAAQLEQIAYENVGHPWVRVVGIVITIAVTIYIGVLAKRAVNRVSDSRAGGFPVQMRDEERK